ncbi:MAG: CRISPR-associated endonuclease Cas2, partial [Streptosporangiaceae bacterium]
MARRRYLMAYDIADPKRLRRVCTLMEDHGERLQYSVFLCDLTVAELAELESAVTEAMNLHEDSVVQIDLGPLPAPAAVRTLGRPRRQPTTGLRSCDRCERSGAAPTPGERSHAVQRLSHRLFAT